MRGTPDAPFRVALVGYGLGGEFFHAPLIAATPAFRLTMVVTRDAGRRARAERVFPGVVVVDDVARLLARAGELDLAVVVTPNRAHVATARAAMEAGLAVVVDKPLAVDATEARTLVAEARRLGRLLVPYQNRRWDGDFLTLRKLLAEGALGQVARFESRFERWRPEVRPGWKESADPGEGGGILLDLGSHLVDQALALFGRATHVYAELDRRRAGAAVEDDAFLALTHASGVRSHLWLNALAGDLGPRFRVLGSRAAWVKHGMDVQEAALRAGAPVDDATWGEEPPERWGTLAAGEAHMRVRTERGAYHRFYAGVAAALRGEAPPPVDAHDAVAMLEVLDAARRSAAARMVIALDA